MTVDSRLLIKVKKSIQNGKSPSKMEKINLKWKSLFKVEGENFSPQVKHF